MLTITNKSTDVSVIHKNACDINQTKIASSPALLTRLYSATPSHIKGNMQNTALTSLNNPERWFMHFFLFKYNVKRNRVTKLKLSGRTL